MASYVTNKDIADILFKVAELLEIDEANTFRVSAYKNAALTVLNTYEPFASKTERGDNLTKNPTIGDDIAKKIREIVNTGELSMLEELEHTLPPQVVELSNVKGIGPYRVKIIESYLGTLTLENLQHAVKNNELARLNGIGPKLQDAIRTHFS